MNPFNSQMNPPPQRPASAVSGQNDPKKRLLMQLMQAAMGTSAGKGIHDAVHGIKTALGAYKNFAKEWDTVHGMGEAAADPVGAVMGNGVGGAGMQRMQPKPQMPAMQPMQSSQPLNAQPPAPQPLPATLPPIQGPMPAFMGGGNPASFG